MPELKSRHLFDIDITVDAPLALGATPYGERRIVHVTGGSFSGDRLKGTIVNGGADWLLGRNDGVLQLDVRITLKTDDEQLIYMTYHGVRHGPAEVIDRLNRGEEVDPSDYYFRTAPRFETASDKYAWINKIICVSMGRRRPDGPSYTVFEIL